ncbi:outer envelope protein 64, mitochondrial isoform X1 [Beta vulgaris subsp. vulgaris]|uniref:outer envelope protein 64, mitochondrial isoform X1 n=1 Tax=Beta vulgaris subsp. vulgaris TaxID=3555 RepID=UPI002036F255|nr:outer envelope protein 64, mitochondrial isoform X1 [Beta vulgaris subsp. vulgaris]
MSESLRISLSNNPKVWIMIGVGVAGIAIVVSRERNRRREKKLLKRQDFGAFIERFQILPFPQPPPPAAPLPLHGLTFAVKDIFEIKGRITGFGNPDWKRTHEEGEKTAFVITSLLKKGATCVGSTVLDELSFGITGENVHYETPINPSTPHHIPGGSSSGSAVAVAAKLVDFAIGTDTIGCTRIPASFCGIFGFRASHGAVSMDGVLPNSQSLDTIGWFARDISVLHRVGQVLLQLKAEHRRSRRFVVADDLFELSRVLKPKASHFVKKTTENLSGYQSPKNVNIGQYIASNVPSLKVFCEKSSNMQSGVEALKALSSVMALLNRYEFKTNHGEWIMSVKPKLGADVSQRVRLAIDSLPEDVKVLYKARVELRAALQNLLKEDGILVLPTIVDHPIKRNSRKGLSAEFYDRALVLSSISSMSGCCQVTVPLEEHDGFPTSISFIALHGADKFLLDTVLDCYSTLREQVRLASESMPLPDANGDLDASELLKEKGNDAYKGKQWNKAISYYGEAIKLNGINATYYCNRAAALLELACFQQAEDDCTKAISLDKKNVKAYLRRGTARESLLRYKEAAEDFKHALVLEPHNKVASLGEKRLKKLMS